MIPPEPDFEDLLLKRVDVAFFAYNADRTLKKLESLGITGLVSQPVGRTAKTAEEFLADAKRSVRLFGQVLGGEAEQRAEDWCRDLDRRVAFVSGRLAGLPAEQRLKVYYVRGPGALNTQGAGSNTFWFSKLGGANMVIESQPLAGKGAISMEDLVRWNPDAVLIGRQYPLDLVLKDERWAGIAAVKNGRVYSTPEGVFYWDGGPEGVLLMELVAKLLYPDRFAGLDMTAEVQDYYARYLWLPLVRRASGTAAARPVSRWQPLQPHEQLRKRCSKPQSILARPARSSACGKGPGCGKRRPPGKGQPGCAFRGAKMALQPIADAAHLVHGPASCETGSWAFRPVHSSGPAPPPSQLYQRSE